MFKVRRKGFLTNFLHLVKGKKRLDIANLQGLAGMVYTKPKKGIFQRVSINIMKVCRICELAGTRRNAASENIYPAQKTKVSEHMGVLHLTVNNQCQWTLSDKL